MVAEKLSQWIAAAAASRLLYTAACKLSDVKLLLSFGVKIDQILNMQSSQDTRDTVKYLRKYLFKATHV
jgi:hypothetical protein